MKTLIRWSIVLLAASCSSPEARKGGVKASDTADHRKDLPTADRGEKKDTLPAQAMDTVAVSEDKSKILAEYFRRNKGNEAMESWMIRNARSEKMETFRWSASSIEFRTKAANGNRYHILLKEGKFDSSVHRFTRAKMHYIEKIDGENFEGTDGGMPQQEIASFQIRVNEKETDVPKEAFTNLYQPNFAFGWKKGLTEYIHAYASRDGKYIFVTMNGGDGAGSYFVIWIFSKRKYIGRFVEHLC